jgi:hypothetical protein
VTGIILANCTAYAEREYVSSQKTCICSIRKFDSIYINKNYPQPDNNKVRKQTRDVEIPTFVFDAEEVRVTRPNRKENNGQRVNLISVIV